MHKASINIFQRTAAYDDNSSCPLISDDIFKAAQRVIENKSTEILRNKDGVFIVSYSPTGPFNDNLEHEWLPVVVMRLQQWNSGGIKKSEFDAFELQ